MRSVGAGVEIQWRMEPTTRLPETCRLAPRARRRQFSLELQGLGVSNAGQLRPTDR